MGGIKMARGRRYEEVFKKQIVALFNGGKSLADLNREYGIAKSTICLLYTSRCV